MFRSLFIGIIHVNTDRKSYEESINNYGINFYIADNDMKLP